MCTLTDCRLAVFPHERIARMARDYPRLAWAFRPSTNIDGAIERELALSLGQRSALSRMAHLFCELHARLDVVGRAARDGYKFPLTQRELSECRASPCTPTARSRNSAGAGSSSWRTGS